MAADRKTRPCVGRDAVKHVAMACMALNHAAQMFLAPGTAAYVLLVAAGYFTAPAVCWFLAEGFYATSSRARYFRRLLIGAAVSQAPYWLCFGTGLSMMSTLVLCFLVLVVRSSSMPRAASLFLQAVLVCVTAWCDWPVVAPMAVVLFDMARAGRAPGWAGFVFCSASCVLLQALSGFAWPWAVLLGTGPLCAGACILYLYAGSQAGHGRRRRFWQYYFYAFYPVHLAVLWGIARIGGFYGICG